MTDSIRILLLSVAIGAAAGLAGADEMGRHDPAEIFGRFDLDGDGRVTADELEGARAARFEELDADGDGQVSEAEFVAHAAARASQRAAEMFARLDADGDGRLSMDTVAAMAGRGPGPRILDRLDADGDGAVTLDEFEAGMERFAERRGRHEGRGFGHRFGGGGAFGRQ